MICSMVGRYSSSASTVKARIRSRLRRRCFSPSRNGTASGLNSSSTCGGFAPARATFLSSRTKAKASGPTKHAVGAPKTSMRKTGPSSRARFCRKPAGSRTNARVSPINGKEKRAGSSRSGGRESVSRMGMSPARGVLQRRENAQQRAPAWMRTHSSVATCSGELPSLTGIAAAREDPFEERVLEHPLRIEPAAERVESVVFGIRRAQLVRSGGELLAPVRPASEREHLRLEGGEIAREVPRGRHVRAEMGAVAPVVGAHPRFVAGDEAELDDEIDAQAVALDHRARALQPFRPELPPQRVFDLLVRP